MAEVIIDGKAVAAAVRTKAAEKVRELKASGIEPGLAVVLVGDDPASASYVNLTERDCAEVGIRSFDMRLPRITTQGALDAIIDGFNQGPCSTRHTTAASDPPSS